MKITINVTREHIEHGGTTCRNCPVALALIDAGFANPSVGYETIYAGKYNSYRESFHCPQSVSVFTRAFDLHKTVRPFQFKTWELKESE